MRTNKTIWRRAAALTLSLSLLATGTLSLHTGVRSYAEETTAASESSEPPQTSTATQDESTQADPAEESSLAANEGADSSSEGTESSNSDPGNSVPDNSNSGGEGDSESSPESSTLDDSENSTDPPSDDSSEPETTTTETTAATTSSTTTTATTTAETTSATTTTSCSIVARIGQKSVDSNKWYAASEIGYSYTDNGDVNNDDITIYSCYSRNLDDISGKEFNELIDLESYGEVGKRNIIAEEAGYYIILAVQTDGETETLLCSSEIIQIDNTAPEITIDSIVQVNGTYTINFTAEDKESGIDVKQDEDGNYTGIYLEDANGEIHYATAVEEDSYTVTFDAKSLAGTKLVVKNQAIPVGNDTTANQAETKLDEEDPNVKILSKNDDNNHSEAIIQVIPPDASEITCKLGDTEIKPNEDGSFTAAEKGEYTIVVKVGDKEYSETIEIGNIDSEIPTVLCGADKGWWNTNVSLTGTAKDDKGIDSVKYVVLDDESDDPFSSDAVSYVTPGENGDFTIDMLTKDYPDGVYYVYIQAIDTAENESDVKKVTVKIDTTKPTAEVSYVYKPQNGWVQNTLNTLGFGLLFREQITVTVDAGDEGSGIASYEYLIVGKNEKEDWTKATKVDYLNADNQFDIDADKGFIGNIYVRVTDNAGNYCDQAAPIDEIHKNAKDEFKGYIVLDNEKPSAPRLTAKTSDGQVYFSEWTNKDVTVYLDPGKTPISGIQRYQYRVDTSNYWHDIDKLTADGKAEITFNTNRNITYKFRSVSNTGEQSENSEITIKIHKTKPDNAEVSIPDPNGSNSWYTTIPTIQITPPTAKPDGPEITTYYSLTNQITGKVIAKNVAYNGDDPQITGDGIYELKVYTKDEAGNQCEKTFVRTIKVDTTNPQCQALRMAVAGASNYVDIRATSLNSLVYRHIYRNSATIYTGFDTTISGLDKIEYQLVSGFTYDNKNWKAYNADAGIPVSPSQNFVVAVRATDKAGNQTIAYSDGVILDNQAPTGYNQAPDISITPSAPNGNGYYNQDVPVSIYVEDPAYTGGNYNANGVYSGLRSVVYRVVADGAITQEGTLYEGGDNLTEADLLHSLNANIVVDSAENNSNDVYVEVVAVDYAGNTRITRTGVGVIQIDITAPTIRISYDNNSPDSANATYFNASRTATIEVTERNFSSSDVILSLTNTDGSVPSISGWSVSGSGDKTVYTGTLTYQADGDYTFDIAFTDLAGNACTQINYVSGTAAPQSFTIDQTKPVITVTYDNNDAVNGKYFDAARVATVVINEHNFDQSRIRITATAARDGKTIAVPSGDVTWSDSGDNHTATVRYEADGDYTFGIEVTDMAGNESDDAAYGDSVAGTDFVIDTTIAKPTVKLNDADGNDKAYRDDLAIDIQLGDINYDSYQIQLMRVRMGKEIEDVTKQFIPELEMNGNSGEGIFQNFEKIQENDGIYTLTVTITDQAGNTETTEVVFTINRFGSVYAYSDYLMSLIADGGQYVQSLEDNLVITEYNADKLEEGSLSIEITRDGKPVDAAAFEVNPVINDKVSVGESGWYQYDYVISTDNFTTDGIYKIVVSSKDEAGNSPENTNYEERAILFRVDSTVPELTSVTGLEKSVYNAQKLTVGYDVYDTIGLKSVKIYVNGTEIGQVTDFTNDANNYNGTFELSESRNIQNVRLVVEDMAGNITDTDAEDFTCAYVFERAITISTNAFIRWYANQPLFWGSIVGACVLIVGVGLLIIWKKKKSAA